MLNARMQSCCLRQEETWYKQHAEVRLVCNRNMKRCAALVITKEMQIKNTMRYHFTYTHVRMAMIKRHKIKVSIGEDVEKREHFENFQ
jgi:hypothetical protein